MTFLKTHYVLKKELTPDDYDHLSHLHSVYGIREVSVEGHTLVILYDASRMHEAEVLARVRCTGVPVDPVQPIAPGGFDHVGQFHDSAWPTEGLSPANQKAK